ncbi:MAG: DUF948 domain-containing protein [Spirochaetes bacterium]|jgi:predicted PurR-regulated permease PerM|nr:DUF948 domain-containing protein [Spirochaetota bacterium]
MDTTTVIVFIVSLVFSVGFLVLVLALVPAVNQLRILFVELEKTSYEVRCLTSELRRVSENVEEKLERMDDVLASSRKIARNVGQTFQFINDNLLARAGWLALIPAAKWGFKLFSKSKGGK